MSATPVAVKKTELSSLSAPSGGGSGQRLLIFSLIFIAACVMFFAELGSFPLFNPDEALYAEPAREMLETGEYLTTLLNYAVRYTKPPLVIWGMAACYQLFGTNEFAARFIGAACGALVVAVTYLFVEKYASRRAAIFACATLITGPLFIGTAREAITDMPLSLMIAGALFSFFHGFTSGAAGWRWVGYLLVGLAVMTKGPVGLVLPAAVMFGYHVLRGNLMQAWRFYRPISGLLLIAAIALPWFAAEIYVTKGAYYYEFLVRENFQRFTKVVDHKYPWWYHLAVIAGGFMPWTVFIPQALVDAVKSLSLSRPRFAVYGLCRELNQLQAFSLFCLLTFTIIVGFFSVSVSKLIPYTLPAFPALAALIGIYLDKVIEQKRSKAVMFPLLVLTVAFAVGLAVVPVAVNRLRDAPAELVSVVYSALLVLLLISAAACASAFRKRIAAAVTFFGIGVYVCFVSIGGHALHVLSQDWEVPIVHFARFASLSQWPIFVFNMRKPSVPFYAQRKVELPADEADLIRALGKTNGAYIIGKTKDLSFLESMPNCRLIARDGKFVLVSQQAVSETNH